MLYNRLIKKLKSSRALKVILFFSVVFLLRQLQLNRGENVRSIIKYTYSNFISHEDIVGLFYQNRLDIHTSNLGSILFKNYLETKYINDAADGKKFSVLIWKDWYWLQRRHVHSYGHHLRFNILEDCSVNNCMFTGIDSDITKMDAVIVLVQKGQLPSNKGRRQQQIWIFLTDESPATLADQGVNLTELQNVFNWSMTYRMDADIPVPYGRTVPRRHPMVNNLTNTNLAKLIPYWNEKRWDIVATTLISHCVEARMIFLEEMKRLLKIDIYGKCSDRKEFTHSCRGHFRSDCKIISHYLFYFVLENSKCLEYITEKVFSNAYSKGAIPIIVGPKLEECYRLLPPDSFLHVDNFKSYEDLSNEILNISRNKTRILQFHRWRNDFKIVNEHGYLGSQSKHLCRICEALNYNDKKEKIYDLNEIRKFLDHKLLCTLFEIQ